MAQFTKYSSSDASAPVLSGTVGSLITLLDAVLINGYGSKPAAGWSKPVATASNISTYKQGAASKAGATLLINDNAPSATPAAREAWATGWVNCLTVASLVGTGNGQFPAVGQSLTSGAVCIEKSSVADATARPWTIFADDRTFWLFTRSHPLSAYLGQNYACIFGFGEFYSYAGASDLGNCFISGYTSVSVTAGAASFGGIDSTVLIGGTGNPGLFLMNNIGGTQSSMKMYAAGDMTKMVTQSTSTLGPIIGLSPCPNPADGSIYIVPASILDGQTAVRGRMRGLYYWMHPLGATSDGAVYVGANELAGKTLTAIAPTNAASVVLIETSNTLDTN